MPFIPHAVAPHTDGLIFLLLMFVNRSVRALIGRSKADVLRR
jgi:hypothetical protein